MIPEHVNPNDVDIWFQDETRVGQQGSLSRLWSLKGQRMTVARQRQFISSYIYGAVCPKTGQASGMVLPYANGVCMKLHLDAISKKIPEGRHGLLIVDRASWHGEKYNRENLTLMHLPPYSPELNPVEQVWAWLKKKKLSNRCYKNYDDIVDAACEAWNVFEEDVDLIKSMCTRSWAIL